MNWGSSKLINESLLTFDCEWAPNFILEHVSNLLIESEVKSTWFVTNESAIIEELKQNSLFELGIHPNFYPGSSQGEDSDSVLKNLKKIVPKSKSIRTHRLLQSSPLLCKFQEYGIENDVSIFLPYTKNITPHYSKYLNLFRFPFFWEDDAEMVENSSWSINDTKLNINGLKIYNFHPILIYLNSKDLKSYNQLKESIDIKKITKQNIQKYINMNSSGVSTFFKELISSLSGKGSGTINDLRKEYEENL